MEIEIEKGNLLGEWGTWKNLLLMYNIPIAIAISFKMYYMGFMNLTLWIIDCRIFFWRWNEIFCCRIFTKLIHYSLRCVCTFYKIYNGKLFPVCRYYSYCALKNNRDGTQEMILLSCHSFIWAHSFIHIECYIQDSHQERVTSTMTWNVEKDIPWTNKVYICCRFNLTWI